MLKGEAAAIETDLTAIELIYKKRKSLKDIVTEIQARHSLFEQVLESEKEEGNILPFVH